MIKNLTKKTILAEKTILRQSLLEISTGLMFHPRLKNSAMLFDLKKEKLASLHMLFVFFPIDVIYLSSEKTVVETKQSLRPFSFYFPKHKARYIIELHEGTIKKTKTEAGDKISFGSQ